jgi:hypothetical protein
MATFYDKTVALCADMGVAISHFVEKELGLQRSTATSWKRGCKPNRATFLKIMAFFDVSEEYLTDNTIPIESGKGTAAAIKWRVNHKPENAAADEKYDGQEINIVKEPGGEYGQPASGASRELGRLEGRIEELEKQVQWYKTEMMDALNKVVAAINDKKSQIL